MVCKSCNVSLLAGQGSTLINEAVQLTHISYAGNRSDNCSIVKRRLKQVPLPPSLWSLSILF